MEIVVKPQKKTIVVSTPTTLVVKVHSGPAGPAGPGVPAGGTTGQHLAKNSNTSYDTEWVDNAPGGVTSVGATSPIASSGGATPVISIQNATDLQDGALTAADHAAFAAKQPAGNYITELTGEVTATGPGSVAATIANDAVTFAKMQNIATDKLLGRESAASGDVEEIGLGTGLALDAATLKLNTMTTLGDIIYGGIDGVQTRLPGNIAANQLFLSSAGDGATASIPSWQPMPTIGVLIYYWTPTASDVATLFKQTAEPYPTLSTITTAGVTDGQLLRTYITEPSNPNRTSIPAGEYSSHVHAAKTAGTKVAQVRVEVWEATSAGVDIAKIADLGPSTALTGVIAEHFIAFSRTEYTMALASSRLKTKVYAVVSGGGSAPTIDLYEGDGTDSRSNFPAPIVDATNFVPYVGATTNINLGDARKVINALDPTSPQDYATKKYVDAANFVAYSQFGGF